METCIGYSEAANIIGCSVNTVVNLLFGKHKTSRYNYRVEAVENISYKAQKEQEKEEKPVEVEKVWLVRIIKGNPGDITSRKEVVAEKVTKEFGGAEYVEWFKSWVKENGNPKNNYFMAEPESVKRVKQD